ncbi:MAG TPA: hypothetical protein VF119_08640 [Candidatus Limnocylindrales bacterium]
MTGPHRRFDPAELVSPGESDLGSADLADSLAAARELEALALDTSIHPSDGFEDRVMAAIAAEPAPRLVLMPASSVRGGRLGAFLLAVRDSWAIATTGGRPMAVRAQALAFVLLVIVAAGALTSVSVVTVGALLGPDGATPDPSPSVPVISPTPEVTALPTPNASPEPTATETTRPTETPEVTRTPSPSPTEADETPEPNETPEGTDDHGGGGGPGSGGSGGGDDGTDNSGKGGGGGSGGSGPG